MERIIVLLILSLGLTISCSRSVDTDAVLSFKFNKANEGPQANSVIAGYYPDLILVNIKYDGKTHFQQWECPYSHGSSSGDISSCVLPSSVAMNKGIPAGANRLVQVLLVYSNEQGSMQFFYSDKTVSFNGGSANVTVGGAGWTINTSGKEGRVAGRLRRGTTNATDLTGTAIGYYQPSNGNPAMEVVKSPVFAGWFDFMFLEDVHFTYKMQGTNEVLISNKKLQDFDKTPAQITAGNLKMIKVHVPAHYEVRTEENNVYLVRNDILNATPVNNLSVVAPPTGLLLDALFDNNPSTYIYQTAAAVSNFNLIFNRFINITEVAVTHGASSADSILLTGYDNVPNPITYPNLTRVALAGSDAVTIGGPFNATNQLQLDLPDDVTQYEELVIKYNNYSSEYNSQRDNYLLFFNITTNDVSTGASASNGVGWTVPGSATFLNERFSFGTDPVDADGAWLTKADDLISASRVFYDNDPSVQTAASELYLEKESPTNGCSTIMADCVPHIFENENVRTAAPFDGPYMDGVNLSCSTNCAFSSALTYVPGITNMRSILFNVPESNHIDHDEIDCAALETAGYTLEDLGTNTAMTAVPAANLTNSRVIMCPYQLIPTGKKYFGFGKELHN